MSESTIPRPLAGLLEALEALDTPRGRYLATMAGAGYLLRRAEAFAAVGTREADEAATALRHAAVVRISDYSDPFTGAEASK